MHFVTFRNLKEQGQLKQESCELGIKGELIGKG